MVVILLCARLLVLTIVSVLISVKCDYLFELGGRQRSLDWVREVGGWDWGSVYSVWWAVPKVGIHSPVY